MKKKKIRLSGKLQLNKETIAALHSGITGKVIGGGSENGPAGSACCQSIYQCPTGSCDTTCPHEPETSPVVCHVPPDTQYSNCNCASNVSGCASYQCTISN